MPLSTTATVAISAFLSAVVREVYEEITGKPLFPAKTPPRWLQWIYRKCARGLRIGAQTLDEFASDKSKPPLPPVKHPDY